LIISKPSNPELFDEYQNSIEILSESLISKKNIIEEELPSYTKDAVEHIEII